MVENATTHLMFVLSGEKRNSVFTEGLHLVRELNWRWVLVSGLGQKNVHGPKNSWDVTPTLGVGFSCYACLKQTTTSVFTRVLFAYRKERKNGGYSKKNNDFGFILLDLLDRHTRVIGWKRKRRWEEEEQMGWTPICRERVVKGGKKWSVCTA